MSREYIDSIKSVIKRQAVHQATVGRVTDDFINGTYEKFVVPKIRGLEKEFWEYPPVDDETLRDFFEIARREYLSINPTKMEKESSLTKEGFQTWLTEERHEQIKWNYLTRYLEHLKKEGRSENVVNQTASTSREIVGKLGDPESGAVFFVKGLVVGEVQSGKTANFNAVINRAIDSGYQLIIVFSGIMEDLRDQTQDRIESDVIGFGSLNDATQTGIKGVGLGHHFGMQGDPSISLIESITSRSSDFSNALLQGGSSLNSPKILVCKKNVSVLRNLINWLADLLKHEDDQHSVPLLILDDEADNASLNNEGAKGREYASKINGHIRAILALFSRKSYLGYTATPFANVLQDRNDPAESAWPVKSQNGEREFRQEDNLYPEDFIVLLESPTNYVGAKQIFETLADGPKLPVITAVTDYNDEFPARLLKSDGSPVENFPSREDWDRDLGPHGTYLGFSNFGEYKKGTRAAKRSDAFPTALPKSLKDSVLCFILSIAIRNHREPTIKASALYEPNNSMLVHVSRFTTWQNDTADMLNAYLAEVRTRIENDRIDEVGSIYVELEKIWNDYFSDVVSNIRDYLPAGYEDEFITPVTYKVVLRHIGSAVDGIKVMAINSNRGDKLNYSSKNPQKVIAVGGNRLSRGFTVRGLAINYFIRPTNYSDTLLQMGRWFGYRPGYIDCCRLFTTRDSIEKFNSTTRCAEELSTEFIKMQDEGKTPSNFLIRVRKHPGVLKITRPSILKNTKTVKWSFQDQLEMTTKFDVSRPKIEKVWKGFKDNTAGKFPAPVKPDASFLITKISGADFLDFLRIPNNFDDTRLEAMIRFIELCQDMDKLVNWTVALKRTGQSKRNLCPDDSGLPCETGMVVRNGPKPNSHNYSLFLRDKEFRASGQSANIVSSPKDLAISLGDHEIGEAERVFKEQKLSALMASGLTKETALQKMPKTLPERIYRERIPETDGVLIIYLFDSYYSFNQDRNEDKNFVKDENFSQLVTDEGYDLDVPIVGYAIGFPPIKDDPGGIYVHGDYDVNADDGVEEDTDPDDNSVPEDDMGDLP